MGDRTIDLRAVPHHLDAAERCAACEKTIRRRTPALLVEDGRYVHQRCAGKPLSAVVAPLAARNKGANERLRDATYNRKRTRLFAKARELGGAGFFCAWCDRQVFEHLDARHPLAAVADHLYGVANDPRHEHLVIACRECNRDRPKDSSAGPRWLAGWRRGQPLPMTPTERLRRAELERARRRATRGHADPRPWRNVDPATGEIFS